MSTNVTVINIFALQPAYTEQGLGQVSGTPSDATKKLQTQLGKMVGTVFAAKWPTADTNDPMTGIMGPWDNSQGGTAPKCATDQITLDFGQLGHRRRARHHRPHGEDDYHASREHHGLDRNHGRQLGGHGL